MSKCPFFSNNFLNLLSLHISKILTSEKIKINQYERRKEKKNVNVLKFVQIYIDETKKKK